LRRIYEPGGNRHGHPKFQIIEGEKACSNSLSLCLFFSKKRERKEKYSKRSSRKCNRSIKERKPGSKKQQDEFIGSRRHETDLFHVVQKIDIHIFFVR
jgi:hypothetical protein